MDEKKPSEPEPWQPKHSVYPPALASANTESFVRWQQSQPEGGLKTHSPLDNYLLPITGAQFVTFLAYTSNGKTAVANHIAIKNARLLPEREIIVTILLEQAIEEVTLRTASTDVIKLDIMKLLFGKPSNMQMAEMARALDKRKTLPWYLVGPSLLDDKPRPAFTPEMIDETLDYIQKNDGVKIRLVILDYFQRLYVGDSSDYRVSLVKAVDKVKNLTFKYQCPWVVCSQAKREAENRMPFKSDHQETSNLEQSSNAQVSLTMPKNHNNLVIGDTYEHGGKGWKVTDNLIVAAVQKQQWGPSPRTVGMNLNYGDHLLHPVEELSLDEVAQGRKKKAEKDSSKWKKPKQKEIPF